MLSSNWSSSKALYAAAISLSVFACGRDSIVTVGPPVCDEIFCVAMPIAVTDTAFAAYGIWPFGVHGANHALDGHPGWDIEFKPGGQVLAAQNGTILSLFADTSSNTTTMQVSHAFGARNYRTVYTSIVTVAAGLSVGASVALGQVLGVPRTQTRMIGTRNVTYAAIHFQLDDFSSMSGLTNVNAISPEPRLLPESISLFQAMWAKTGYSQELCEPFPTNSRAAVYPVTRRWISGAGASARRLDVTCQISPTTPHQFALDAPGDQSSGALLVNPLAGGSGEIDFNRTGTVQRGLYRIVSDSLFLQLAAIGAPRPGSLATPVVYVTAR